MDPKKKMMRGRGLSSLGRFFLAVGAIYHGPEPHYWLKRRWWHPLWIIAVPLFALAAFMVGGFKGLFGYFHYQFREGM